MSDQLDTRPAASTGDPIVTAAPPPAAPAPPSDPATPSAASPIADISYRNYDGPLKARYARWWVVALAGIRMATRKWWVWLLAAIACWPYLVFGFVLWIQSRFPQNGPGIMFQADVGQRYAAQFLEAFGWQIFWLMIIALSVGASSIAADNRTSALQIYLSKPITKGDYLLGKWVGIFVPVFTVALVPALVLYLYCLLSYMSDGFLRQEPWLVLRIVGACAVPAAVYASILVGVSAWSKSSLMAGAITAGLYFGSWAISQVLWLAIYLGEVINGRSTGSALVQNASLGGMIHSLGWNIYHVTIKQPMMQRRHAGALEVVAIPPPALWVVLLVVVLLIVLGVATARARIRAVEVVTG